MLKSAFPPLPTRPRLVLAVYPALLIPFPTHYLYSDFDLAMYRELERTNNFATFCQTFIRVRLIPSLFIYYAFNDDGAFNK